MKAFAVLGSDGRHFLGHHFAKFGNSVRNGVQPIKDGLIIHLWLVRLT